MYNQITHPDFNIWFEQLKPGQIQKIPVQPHPFLIAYLLNHLDSIGPHVLVSVQKELFIKIHEALLFFEPEQKVFFLEEASSPWQEELSFSHQAEHRRLRLIAQAQRALKTDIFMIHPQSLMQRTIPPDLFKAKFICLKKGDLLPLNFTDTLMNLGYQSRDHVEQMGEFSMRGAVLDLFCPLADSPFRIDLIGDEVAQIKFFNINTQISSKETQKVQIPPAKEWSVYNKKETYQKMKETVKIHRGGGNKLFPFWEWNKFLLQGAPDLYKNKDSDNSFADLQKKKSFISEQKNIYDGLRIWKASFLHKSQSTIMDHFHSPLIWNMDEPNFLKNTMHSWEQEIQKSFKEKQEHFYPSFSDMYLPDWRTKKMREINFDPFSNLDLKKFTSFFSTLPSKHFFKSPDWTEQVRKQREKGVLVFISAVKEKTRKKLTLELESSGMKVEKEGLWFQMKEAQQANYLVVHLIYSFTGKNLIWPAGNIIFLKADTALPDSKRKHILPKENKQALSMHFAELQPGDLIVHRQYGIGCFQKLELLNFGSGENEFLILEYKEGDLLYVPVYALHQVQKYSGPSSTTKRLLDKLGDKKWLNTKEKVRKRIKDMALELMNLYSLRSSLKRKKFSNRGESFEKFESEFIFRETPDQKKAIESILQDLTQKEKPTDRLICGDTGFGKTEVAMRAAFKVAEEGFQVCFMAPTTLLSFQHFERFKERFNNWPVFIQLLNRFTPSQERKQILKETKAGKVDILIGTHRILSRDIHFKKLGLLIIDEEHLFGVKSKEKIKNWHSQVDTISLSATPIPRSLSMSLAGLRDMSTILTPPLNRKAVETFISPFNEELIKKAILKELNRNGQIIFIHNRIATISKMEKKLKSLLPSTRIRMAHGQMKNLQQKVVLDFFHQKFDLLLCTTIVESGMDFPKASTLFISQAEQFGLSQLHQLRGRIGRSARQSYCYLMIDPNKKISQQALERLKIIQENNQPGAGMMIAQYDLEMRGAGELMGEEQSGFLQDVGYEMYFEFLQENIAILKNEKTTSAPEPDLQFKQAAFIPNSYIPHEKARLIFYKKLATAQSEQEVEQIKTELKDFAGPLPKEAENLILLSHCRPLAKKLHIRELAHRPPWLYMNLADSTPLCVSQVLKWIELGICKWQNKNTLKFPMEENNLLKILKLLKTL